MLPYVGMKMYRTASVLIAYEYRTSKVSMAYLQRIWTSWPMPDDRVTYLTYNLRIIMVAIRRVRRVRRSYADIRWSYAEYAVRTPTYAGICPKRYSYATHRFNTVSIRYFRGLFVCIKIVYEFSFATLTFHSYSTV